MASTEPRLHLAGVRRWLWLAAGLAVAALAALAILSSGAGGGQAPAAKRFGGAFTLTAADGRVVTERTVSTKPIAIFFGYTRCPDVCPTSLARMARLRKQLGADGMKFDIVFVSVDPGHDRPDDIGRYVALFGTPILGLTGSEAQIAQIKKGFGVYSAKVPQPGGDYTIDHSTAIYLIAADGAFQDIIGYDESEPSALAKLRSLIA